VKGCFDEVDVSLVQVILLVVVAVESAQVALGQCAIHIAHENLIVLTVEEYLCREELRGVQLELN
jgi:hypothetical protein